MIVNKTTMFAGMGAMAAGGAMLAAGKLLSAKSMTKRKMKKTAKKAYKTVNAVLDGVEKML